MRSISVAVLLAMSGCNNQTGSSGSVPGSRKYADAVENETAAAGMVRTLNTNQMVYSTSYEKSGFAPDLQTLGPGPTGKCASPSAAHACLIDSTVGCAYQPCVKDAYRYAITPILSKGIPSDYVIFATPTAPGLGRKDFCSSSDDVIRFQRAENPPSRVITSVAECQSWSVL